jgi:hypothetical protein
MRFVAAVLFCGALGACASMRPEPASTGPGAPDTYIILFQGKVTEVNARAAALLNSVAAKANAHRDQLVQVGGPPTKSAFGYDARLARQRLEEVQHELEAAGVDKERIVRTLLSHANVRADGTGPQRVEIRLVSPPRKSAKTHSAAAKSS